MRMRALQMSSAAWLCFAAVPVAMMLGRSLRVPHAIDWESAPSAAAVAPAARAPRRLAVGPTSTGRGPEREGPNDREKAAALLLLVVLGGDRFAVGSR
jgi:hypothetical protein